jgi:hypothetical protein
MKKLICLALLAGLLFAGLPGCKKAAPKSHPKAKGAPEAAAASKERPTQDKPAPETMSLVSKAEVKLSDKPALLTNGSFEKWQAGEPAPKGFNAPEGAKSAIRKEMKDVADGVMAVSQTWQALDAGDSFLMKFGANVAGLKARGRYLLEIKAKNTSEKHVTVSAWQDTGSPTEPFERIKDAVIDIPPNTKEFTTFSCLLVPNTERSVRVFTGCNDKQGAFPATVIWEDWKITETN